MVPSPQIVAATPRDFVELQSDNDNPSATATDVDDNISSITNDLRNLVMDVTSRPEEIGHEETSPTTSSLVLRRVENILKSPVFSHNQKRDSRKPNHVLADVEESVKRLIVDGQYVQVASPSRRPTAALTVRNATLAPQGKLPIELWAQIFIMCLPNEDDFVKPNPKEAPLLLCQICSDWRRIATGTCLLWSRLSIRGSWRRYIWKASLECWLQRSENAVLYLDISIPAYLEPTFDEHIAKLILSTADRWYHLRLNLPDNLLRRMLSNYMPSLHTLEFNSTYPISSLEVPASHIPRLKTISLLTKSLYPQPLSIPWQQIANISLQCWLNIRQHLEILAKCPRLESYCMCLVHAEIPSNSSPLFMKNLRHLEVITFNGHSMGPILSHLQLPKLTRLSLTVPHESPSCGIVTWPTFSIISLVERSCCPLEKMTLTGVGVTKECIRDMKRCIPSLVSVDFL